MKKSFLPKLRTMRNNKSQTLNNTFYAEHKKLCEQVKVKVKGLAKFNMVVATLITVVLVHALIVSISGDRIKGYIVFF